MKSNLIRVGFWKDTKALLDLSGILQRLPDPRELVDHEWMKAKRERIAQYLDAGQRINQAMGYSYCRFACGVVGSAMGTADLTDGTYVWPEGLSHYVRVHHVRLPKAFTKHILARPAVGKPVDPALCEANEQLGDWLREKRRERAAR